MRILVFTEGTILDDRDGDTEWKMIGNAPSKLREWRAHGATILYLSSKRNSDSLAKVREALRKGVAPEGELFFRRGNEHYGQTAERAAPDVIVEDDCASIGGQAEMTYPKLGSDSKAKIKSVVIPEWGGIDHLPDEPRKLLEY